MKVTYSACGGTPSAAPEGDYFARDKGGGKIELYDTEAHAKAAGSTTGRKDLTSSGAGSSHKFTRHKDDGSSDGDVTFNPNPNSIRILDVGEHNGLTTGDEVVYHQGAGAPPVGGLVDGHTYFVIMLDDTHAQLADTRDHAEAGTGADAVVRRHGRRRLPDRIHAPIQRQAQSGRRVVQRRHRGIGVGQPPMLTTTAEAGSNVTLADGTTAAPASGAVSVRPGHHPQPVPCAPRGQRGPGRRQRRHQRSSRSTWPCTTRPPSPERRVHQRVCREHYRRRRRPARRHRPRGQERRQRRHRGRRSAVAVYISESHTSRASAPAAPALDLGRRGHHRRAQEHHLHEDQFRGGQRQRRHRRLRGRHLGHRHQQAQLDGRNVTSTGGTTLRSKLTIDKRT
jgi:hypothetical protein